MLLDFGVCQCLFARYGKRTPPPPPWTDRVAIVLNDILLFAAQCYLCYRLWVLYSRNHLQRDSGSPPCDVLVVAHSLGKTGIGPGMGSAWLPAWAFCLCGEISIFLPQITDVYLSATIAYYSLQTRKKAVGDRYVFLFDIYCQMLTSRLTILHSLDYMLRRLASLAVTTCIPPAIVSAGMAILEIINPSGRPSNFCTVILGALYTVCILHALNARHQILAKARSRSTMKTAPPSVTGRKVPPSSSSNVAKKLALRSKKNEEDPTFSGTESAKQIYSIYLQ
ncbi:BQ5605_C017g08464 [Microbotryum silenes-dioicae]|uniref:BQ5605_C017g08464 protein n=1 Tax=Microbotryum silenes-dioicae TaxID=796604 RepID=A0A2X0LZE7_9BASI|nr:BQ5605_C017g08464 [Microbotryum silenes-dioicae]